VRWLVLWEVAVRLLAKGILIGFLCLSGIVGMYWGCRSFNKRTCRSLSLALCGKLFWSISVGHITTPYIGGMASLMGKHAGIRVGYWIRYTCFPSDLCSGLSSCLFDHWKVWAGGPYVVDGCFSYLKSQFMYLVTDDLACVVCIPHGTAYN